MSSHKIYRILIPLVILGVSSCSTPFDNKNTTSSGKRIDPDPVLFIYHVKPGSEDKLRRVLKAAWEIYRKEDMVLDQPHILVLVKEDSDHWRFVEIFTWVNCYVTEYPPDSVLKVLAEIRTLCEDRGGYPAIEERQAKMLAPFVFE